ncbi:unnamed protein product [Amoebophrya sp. A120]|nr:unnamed protein product [Amoebophrya sp. A120]|eukprot:GSA120T00020826001.1
MLLSSTSPRAPSAPRDKYELELRWRPAGSGVWNNEKSVVVPGKDELDRVLGCCFSICESSSSPRAATASRTAHLLQPVDAENLAGMRGNEDNFDVQGGINHLIPVFRSSASRENSAREPQEQEFILEDVESADGRRDQEQVEDIKNSVRGGPPAAGAGSSSSSGGINILRQDVDQEQLDRHDPPEAANAEILEGGEAAGTTSANEHHQNNYFNRSEQSQSVTLSTEQEIIAAHENNNSNRQIAAHNSASSNFLVSTTNSVNTAETPPQAVQLAGGITANNDNNAQNNTTATSSMYPQQPQQFLQQTTNLHGSTLTAFTQRTVLLNQNNSPTGDSTSALSPSRGTTLFSPPARRENRLDPNSSCPPTASPPARPASDYFCSENTIPVKRYNIQPVMLRMQSQEPDFVTAGTAASNTSDGQTNSTTAKMPHVPQRTKSTEAGSSGSTEDILPAGLDSDHQNNAIYGEAPSESGGSNVVSALDEPGRFGAPIHLYHSSNVSSSLTVEKAQRTQSATSSKSLISVPGGEGAASAHAAAVNARDGGVVTGSGLDNRPSTSHQHHLLDNDAPSSSATSSIVLVHSQRGGQTSLTSPETSDSVDLFIPEEKSSQSTNSDRRVYSLSVNGVPAVLLAGAGGTRNHRTSSHNKHVATTTTAVSASVVPAEQRYRLRAGRQQTPFSLSATSSADLNGDFSTSHNRRAGTTNSSSSNKATQTPTSTENDHSLELPLNSRKHHTNSGQMLAAAAATSGRAAAGPTTSSSQHKRGSTATTVKSAYTTIENETVGAAGGLYYNNSGTTTSPSKPTLRGIISKTRSEFKPTAGLFGTDGAGGALGGPEQLPQQQNTTSATRAASHSNVATISGTTVTNTEKHSLATLRAAAAKRSQSHNRNNNARNSEQMTSSKEEECGSRNSSTNTSRGGRIFPADSASNIPESSDDQEQNYLSSKEKTNSYDELGENQLWKDARARMERRDLELQLFHPPSSSSVGEKTHTVTTVSKPELRAVPATGEDDVQNAEHERSVSLAVVRGQQEGAHQPRGNNEPSLVPRKSQNYLINPDRLQVQDPLLDWHQRWEAVEQEELRLPLEAVAQRRDLHAHHLEQRDVLQHKAAPYPRQHATPAGHDSHHGAAPANNVNYSGREQPQQQRQEHSKHKNFEQNKHYRPPMDGENYPVVMVSSSSSRGKTSSGNGTTVKHPAPHPGTVTTPKFSMRLDDYKPGGPLNPSPRAMFFGEVAGPRTNRVEEVAPPPTNIVEVEIQSATFSTSRPVPASSHAKHHHSTTSRGAATSATASMKEKPKGDKFGKASAQHAVVAGQGQQQLHSRVPSSDVGTPKALELIEDFRFRFSIPASPAARGSNNGGLP